MTNARGFLALTPGRAVAIVRRPRAIVADSSILILDEALISSGGAYGELYNGQFATGMAL